LSLGIVAGHEWFGITEEHAARVAIALASLWWAGFSLFTLFLLKETGTAGRLPEKYGKSFAPAAYARIGIARTCKTLAKAARFRNLGLFLLAYMIYNDGIQTVINMATIYGRVELGLSATVLMLVLLVIQVVAFFGALLFGKLGGRISAKYALMASLVMWSLVVIYAYVMESAAEFFVLGIAAGIVLGGSQALSRSLFGSMIPKESSAEFYGFYSVFDKFSAIGGPLVFSIIGQLTGSLRLSIVSIIVFFIGGLVLLAFVDVEKGKAARDSLMNS
ncbi:MAG TPA: MFS transporter, partial [bacterium]|nr:MFS transporter [bacterium]